MRILLAEDGAGVCAYTAFGANRDPDAAPGVAEIRTFFVHPRSWRGGTGRELMRAALDELRGMGYDAATLWSFADNDRANAFYEAAGFARDGAERAQAVWGNIPELRYRRTL